MNKLKLTKEIFPHVVIIVIFVIISIAYFSPVLEGKRIEQLDGVMFKGSAKEASEFRDTTGEEPLWVGTMFGGMPAYLISTVYSGNLIQYVDEFIKVGPRPACYIFICLLGFYILMLAFRINRWASVLGAVAFAFSTYLFLIISAGHNTKIGAIAYMPWVLAGIVMVFRGRRLWGALTFAFGLAFEMMASHPQITYYTLIIVLIYGIGELTYAIRNKQLSGFIKSVAVLLLPAVIAVGTDIARLKIILEYGKHSIRGKTELTQNNDQTSGLDKSYATDWSYGIDETLNLFIPGYKGGSSHVSLGTDSELYKAARKNGYKAREIIKICPLYWGTQPFTVGPTYLGAIVVFLFVLALFLLKGRDKWWLIAATVLSIMLAWGKNFPHLTDFFLDYVPMYNKFRTVAMILVIAQLTVPLGAILVIQRIISGELQKTQVIKALKWTLGITGGIALLVALFPGISGNFSSPGDARFPEWYVSAIQLDRMHLLRGDAFRSLVFVLFAAAGVWVLITQKIKKEYVLAGLTFLVLVDLWAVNKRYMNNDQFVSPKKNDAPFEASFADKEILKDKDPSYRVLNLNKPFTDARTSYFHKSIGGYHAAKMRRYEELIEAHLRPEILAVVAEFKSSVSLAKLDSALHQQHVLNMLNMRYMIYNPKALPIKNEHALGNAWLIDKVKIVENADEEIADLGTIDPANTALVDQRFENLIPSAIKRDETASIELAEYKPNYLKYNYNAANEQIAVFSEIYYPLGWEAYVDGQKTPHFRANYVLRAMKLPGGNHTIEFRFHPKSYFLGNTINMICSILLFAFAIGVFAWEIIKRRKNKIDA